MDQEALRTWFTQLMRRHRGSRPFVDAAATRLIEPSDIADRVTRRAFDPIALPELFGTPALIRAHRPCQPLMMLIALIRVFVQRRPRRQIVEVMQVAVVLDEPGIGRVPCIRTGVSEPGSVRITRVILSEPSLGKITNIYFRVREPGGVRITRVLLCNLALVGSRTSWFAWANRLL